MRTYSVPVSLAAAAAIGLALWIALEVAPWGASGSAAPARTADGAVGPKRRLWAFVASLVAMTAISLIVVTRDARSLAHAVSLAFLALLIPVAAATAHGIRTNSVGRAVRRNAAIVLAGALAAAVTYALGR